jgi:hypothetical protein
MSSYKINSTEEGIRFRWPSCAWLRRGSVFRFLTLFIFFFLVVAPFFSTYNLAARLKENESNVFTNILSIPFGGGVDGSVCSLGRTKITISCERRSRFGDEHCGSYDDNKSLGVHCD